MGSRTIIFCDRCRHDNSSEVQLVTVRIHSQFNTQPRELKRDLCVNCSANLMSAIEEALAEKP